MKTLKNILLIASVVGLFVVAACDGGDDPADPTTGQQISKTWVIADVGGSGVDGTGFEITFNTDSEGNPSTYSVTPGNVSEDLGQKPNFNSTSNSGSWSFNTAETEITFESGSTASTVTVSGISETSITMSWTVPFEKDKTEPTYTFRFSPK